MLACTFDQNSYPACLTFFKNGKRIVFLTNQREKNWFRECHALECDPFRRFQG